jgi:hypothetical protein
MRRLILALALAVSAFAQGPSRPCTSGEYSKLDLWIGEWDVVSDAGETLGHNKIEKIVGGCAILENWTDAQGGSGKSLFYFFPQTKQWKQVWVTDGGNVKEKQLLPEFAGPGVRFQGTIRKKDGGTYLDRTTLTPLANGDVRQVIELSFDGGKTWDAKYRWVGIYKKVK